MHSNEDKTPADQVSGHRDPDGEAPWAMQLVVNVEKTAKPSATAVLEAAARATVYLMASPEAQPEGPWGPSVDRWLQGRIRKIVRRARGQEWSRVCELDGVTVGHRNAVVRAFVPCPTDAVPSAIAKLQVKGLDLEDPDRSAALDVPSGGLLIAMDPTAQISVGKAAAQAAHASTVAWLDMPGHVKEAWRCAGFPLRVVHPAQEEFSSLVPTCQVHIVDAGFTELQGPARTCIARW